MPWILFGVNKQFPQQVRELHLFTEGAEVDVTQVLVVEVR